jgi:lon-related putative ATP-dependent protease
MRPLAPEQLRLRVDVAEIPHETTQSVQPLEGIIGQERAVRSLRFGLGMRDEGYHIFVAGPEGTGRTTAVRNFLEAVARPLPLPSDWCYVYNFEDPFRPRAIKLPPGGARELQREVAVLITAIRRRLGEAFEGDRYTGRREGLVRAFQEERTRVMGDLEVRAQEQGFVIEPTPAGLLVIPVTAGRPITEQDLVTMEPAARERIRQRQSVLEEQVRAAIKQVRSMEKAFQGKLQDLDRDVVQFETEGLLEELMDKYSGQPDVTAHLEALQQDIVRQLEQFRGGEGAEELARRYQVNVMVDNAGRQGAPVVIESNPTYPNIFGRIEKEARMGVLSTDFTLIRSGALHAANGGFLVLRVEELFRNPFTWESLKRALRQREIEVEELAERAGFLTTRTLRPVPIPLDIKVILVGSPQQYYRLFLYDPDFAELFKVKAEFEPDMERTAEHTNEYVRFLCTVCQKESLRHLDRDAIGQMLEYAARLAEHQEKLSTHFAEAADVLREANYWAGQADAPVIGAEHIRRAVDEKLYRLGMVRDRIQELIRTGVVGIDVAGARAGQVNGLAVISYGNVAFGRPSRITATVGTGRAGVLNIEREARLSGRIHTKGVLILEGFLTELFAHERPLSLSARLVFEQSYEEIDGDSASSTELYALLSALGAVPIRQGLAVTGSVNQKGEVQAIGGVNEKIEGYFDICKAKGLTGEQGVLIPATNVENLMLREDVVAAAAAGQFHIFPVKTVAEGIELLTGVPADLVFERVQARLDAMADAVRAAAGEGMREAAATRTEDTL